MKTVEIEALKPFAKDHRADLCEPGERFDVGETRADELARNGLARRTDEGRSGTLPDSKAAPAPENKMAPEPENKAPRGERAKLSGRD